MTFFPRSTWRYAILIIVLFAFAAFTASHTLSFLIDELDRLGQDADSTIVRLVTIAIWLLTFGFMFLAGALGLWGIRTSVEIESRRRIAHLLNAMDYLTDGVLMLDASGMVLAANPAAHSMAAKKNASHPCSLREIFPMLNEENADRLLLGLATCEIELDYEFSKTRRSLRFRSQHSAGVRLVIVSDVTELKAQEIHRKQIAQLQLVGRIAAGVAHDFNNILCAVSGHAALINRMQNDPDAMRQSLDFIQAEADRGTQLSRQLLELSRSRPIESFSNALDENIEEAASLLRVALSSAWTVNTTIHGNFPPVPLAPNQIEQVVLNLGLQAADAQHGSGSITITLSRPGEGHLTDVDAKYVAVIIVSSESGPNATPAEHQTAASHAEQKSSIMADSGIISSVVRSLVEEVGGRLDHFCGAGAPCVYRVCFPRFDLHFSGLENNEIDQVFKTGFAGTKALLVLPKQQGDILENMFYSAGAHPKRALDALAALVELEGDPDLNFVVLHATVLGNAPAGIIRAMARLNPSAVFLALGTNDIPALSGSGINVVVAPDASSPQKMARLLLETVGKLHSSGVGRQITAKINAHTELPQNFLCGPHKTGYSKTINI